MLEKYLSMELASAINKIPYSSLCELRLREDNPVIVNVMGENYYLGNNCYTKEIEDALVVSKGYLQGIIDRISRNSMYTINDQLIDGYVSIGGGIRVGVCGEVVSLDGRVKTIKNISSLNFRFPHYIRNCSMPIYNYIVKGGEVKNTLIVSPPGAGKTTMLRDIIYQLSRRERLLNILVIDERQELCEVYDGITSSRLKNIDIISGSTKKFAFNNGIRSMKPDVIITDEISIDRDIGDIKSALTSGVKVIASIHSSSVFDLKKKPEFIEILSSNLFDRYIVLSNADGVGTIEAIYNETLACIG